LLKSLPGVQFRQPSHRRRRRSGAEEMDEMAVRTRLKCDKR